MRLFECPSCNGRVFFKNLACTCGTALVFKPVEYVFDAQSPYCANRDVIACNWAAETGKDLCSNCALSEVVPDLSSAQNVEHWAEVERTKRWVCSNLGRWGWFGPDDPRPKPVFHLLSENTGEGQVAVSMGHEDGTITINVSEADPAIRYQRRDALGEPFRTMMGHMRHELAHFMFERFSGDAGFLQRFRELFGDERADYAAALSNYYSNGVQQDWDSRYISTYASSHPHEDWAESFAHLLHLTDMIDSLTAFRLSGPELPPTDYDAYLETDADRLITYGARVGIALNHVNRSMGLSDIYPFVHTPVICEKMAFVHGCLVRGPGGNRAGLGSAKSAHAATGAEPQSRSPAGDRAAAPPKTSWLARLLGRSR